MLHVLQKRLWFFDMNARRRGGYRFVIKHRNDLLQCARLDDRIRIKTSDEISRSMRESEIHRGMFAAVFFVENTHLTVLKLSRDLKRVVGRTVIHDDDLKLLFGIVE